MLSTILIFCFIIFTSFPEIIYLSPTFAIHNTPPEIIHTHSREAEHQGATRGLLEWPSKRMSNGEDVVHIPTFTELQQELYNRFTVYLLLKSSSLVVLPLLVPTYTVIVRYRTSRRNAYFWATWTPRFLTPCSCGGIHYCRATCRTSVSLLFISHSNYATPTKTWNTHSSGLPRHFFGSFSY